VDLTGSSTNDQENFNFISDKGANSSKEYTRMAAFNKQGNAYYAIDEAL
jgi:TRAF-interacting protein